MKLSQKCKIKKKKYQKKELKILFNLIPELKLTLDGILLKQNRIVKQHRNIELPHENHPGTAKTIILLREKNYFVNTEAKVKAKISKCVLCAAVSKHQSLEHSILPPNPWHTTEIDFHTILTPNIHTIRCPNCII